MTLLSSIGAFENLTKAELGRLEQGLRLLEPRDGAEDSPRATRPTPYTPSSAASGACASARRPAQQGPDGRGVPGRRHLRRDRVIDGRTRTAAAVAEGRLRVARIGASTFLTALSTSPKLGEAICRIMARRLRRTFELFQDATFERLDVRLARESESGVPRRTTDRSRVAAQQPAAAERFGGPARRNDSQHHHDPECVAFGECCHLRYRPRAAHGSRQARASGDHRRGYGTVGTGASFHRSADPALCG